MTVCAVRLLKSGALLGLFQGLGHNIEGQDSWIQRNGLLATFWWKQRLVPDGGSKETLEATCAIEMQAR
jgi:hypothetical protein